MDDLRTHSEVAAEYAAEKQRLAAQFPHDRAAYSDTKGPFLWEVHPPGRRMGSSTGMDARSHRRLNRSVRGPRWGRGRSATPGHQRTTAESRPAGQSRCRRIAAGPESGLPALSRQRFGFESLTAHPTNSQLRTPQADQAQGVLLSFLSPGQSGLVDVRGWALRLGAAAARARQTGAGAAAARALTAPGPSLG